MELIHHISQANATGAAILAPFDELPRDGQNGDSLARACVHQRKVVRGCGSHSLKTLRSTDALPFSRLRQFSGLSA
jgi:hypothetical protein